MAMPPLKHVVDDLLTIPYNNTSVQTITLAKGVINPVYTTNNTDVRNGSKITKMTIMLDIVPQVSGDTVDTGFYDWYVGFNIAGAQTLPNPNSVGGSDILQQIFHQDQGAIQFVTAAAPQPAINNAHVIRLELNIPRSWQIINRDDQIQLLFQKSSFNTNGNSLNVKLKCIYKEIYP